MNRQWDWELEEEYIRKTFYTENRQWHWGLEAARDELFPLPIWQAQLIEAWNEINMRNLPW